MASAKVMMAEAATPATPAAESVADPAPAPVLSPAGLAAGVLAELAELALVLSSAGPGGLSGVSSGQALAVVEAVEAVKAWADAVSIDATAAMVAEFETDFVPLEPEPSHSNPPSTWECRRFLRTCRSAAAAEIQVATGLPITQCQRRVWFAACEPERVGPVREQMRLGRVTLARAMALTEATGHLDAFTASVIANRVLRPLTGPDGVPLPGVAPLSEATFRARLHRQQLIVSLSTILDLDLDLDQGVGQIPGWGCVSGQQGRALALRAGSIWKRIVTDPLTGRAIEVSAGTYKVPSGMAGQVRAGQGPRWPLPRPGLPDPRRTRRPGPHHRVGARRSGRAHCRDQPRRAAPRASQPQDRRLLGQRPVTGRDAVLDHRHRPEGHDLPLRVRPPRRPTRQDLNPGIAARPPTRTGHQPRHPPARALQHLRRDRLGTSPGPRHPTTPATHLGHGTSQPETTRSRSHSRSGVTRPGAATVLMHHRSDARPF